MTAPASHWEVVAEERDGNCLVDVTARLPVFGGWLYRTWKSGLLFDVSDTMAMVFVPEQTHRGDGA